MEKENLTTQQWDWIGEHPARALSPEVQARIFSRESHVANPATCVLSSKSTGKKIIALSTAFVFLWSMCITPVMAETINLQGGSVEVNVQDNTTNWNVTGNPVWNMPEFNVAQGSIYNIAGLGAGASLALLVNGGSASNIFGTMNLSNIAFILQNIAGINIGSSAMINLSNASLIASTLPLNLSMTDFLKENYQFSGQGGFLSNEGHILGGKGDLVALIANAIENKGTIEVPMGTVALAAGKTVTVGISGDGLVSIGVDEATANALGLKDQIKNTGTIQANGGHVILNAKAVDGLFEKAINIAKGSNSVAAVIADDGKIEFVAQGDVTNTGTLQAKRGKIEMDVKGDIETMGNLEAAYFREKAAAFRIGGDYHVDQSFHDNLDNALTYVANANVHGTINDIANIIVNAEVTLTLDADTTFNADSDANGTGAFLMDATATILGSGYNLTFTASETSTFGKISNIGNLTLNAQKDVATYQVRNAVQMNGDLTVNVGATFTGGYDVTVNGGDVTGDGTIDLSGGTFILTGTGNFGGKTNWSFAALRFGDGTTEGITKKNGPNKVTILDGLDIKEKHELQAGTSTWDLSWGGGYLTDVIQITAGTNHALALLASGIVKAWGNNEASQLGDGTTQNRSSPITVPGLSGVKSVAAGGNSSFAIKASDGSVWAWGFGNWGQLGDGTGADHSSPVQIPGLSGVASISANLYHTLALMADGTVKSWGYNGNGQLGDGTNAFIRYSPVTVVGLSGVTAIAAGFFHSLALLSNGTVKAWGDNTYGQLGNGTNTSSSSPVTVDGISTATQIAAGEYHSLALLSGGTVQAWGANNTGQLGDGTNTNRTTPVTVLDLSGVTQIAAGSNFNIARLSDGTLKSWGSNFDGQLGDGTTTARSTPVTVPGISGVIGIATASRGGAFSLALLPNGTVKGWGMNNWGQIGNNSPVSFVTSPKTSVSGLGGIHLTDISQIVAGDGHALALKTDGSRVYAWGDGGSGQLGYGLTDTALTAVEVMNPDGTGPLTGVKKIAAGFYHSLALMFDGTVVSWGRNDRGQLGDGTTSSRLLPVAVLGLTGVLDIAAGAWHSLALVDDGTGHKTGTVSAWGIFDGTSPVIIGGLSSVTSIAASYMHSLALLSDGTVKAWGYNTYGELGDGTTISRWSPVTVSGLSNVKSIAAGMDHSMAILNDGTVKTWGHNNYGQLGDGTTTDRLTPVTVTDLSGLSVKSIVGGVEYTLACLEDGTVKSWGGNWYGQLGDGTTATQTRPVTDSALSGVTALAAGNGYSFGVSSSDDVKAWGFNYYGALGINRTSFQEVTPQYVVTLTRAPFISEGTFTAQDSTFTYSGGYAFGRVVTTVVANVEYHDLVLKYTLNNYVLPLVDKTLLNNPSESDFDPLVTGKLTFLGEHQSVSDIDVAAARQALADKDASARAFEAMMQAHMGDRSLALDFFSQFFSPDRAMNFTTDVRVQEGAVYTLDGLSEMSLLTQGESLRVAFKEKKSELTRMEPKELETKPLQPVSNPVIVTGDNPLEPRDLLSGQSKAATPVVMRDDETAGRYGTLKNPGKDVFVKCAGGEWQAAKDGMVIMPGDVVKTASAGSVEVMLDGGKVGHVEVKAGSLFRINKAETNPATGEKTTLLELAVGKLIAHVEKLQGNSKFEVRTPTALTGVRGTVFEVVVKEKA